MSRCGSVLIAALLVALAACSPAVVVPGSDEASSTSSSGTTLGPLPSSSSAADPRTTSDPDPTGGDGGTTGRSTSTGESSTAGGSLDSSASSGGFIPTTGSERPCDIYLQDCPKGEKCNAYADDGGTIWNAVGCFPVDSSPGQPGEPCEVTESGTSGFDTCDLGSMCWYVELDALEGSCVALCEGAPQAAECSNPAASCLIANDGVLNLCLPTCDPSAASCPEGQACRRIKEDFVCLSDENGSVADGDACSTMFDCGSGSDCIPANTFGPSCEGFNCCSAYCDVDVATCSEPEHECVPYFIDGEAPLGLESLGICQLPPK